MSHVFVENIVFRGKNGRLEVANLHNGWGDPYVATIVFHRPAGAPEERVFVGEFPPVGVELVARSLDMTARFNSHEGD